MDTSYKLKVDNSTFDMTAADLEHLDLVHQGEQIHVLENNKAYKVELLSMVGKEITLSVNNTIHTVTIMDDVDQLIDEMGLNKMQEIILKDIKAPMPGLILDISVTPGQAITSGTPLLILEAMKMENVIKATGEGVVKSILAHKGETVEKNQVIIEME